MKCHVSIYRSSTNVIITTYLFMNATCLMQFSVDTNPFIDSCVDVALKSGIFAVLPLSRPGQVAPSRSCCPRRGSSSPTPQSSTQLSSRTPWVAHSLLPTGGEQHCFILVRGLRPSVFKLSIQKFCTSCSLETFRNKALPVVTFIHIYRE